MAAIKSAARSLCKSADVLLGLTGGIASGKSNVRRILADCGAVVVDADKVAHDAYLPGQPAYVEILETFTRSVLDPKGYIDRKALGSKIFADPSLREKLNSIVWPHVKRMVHEELERGVEKLSAGTAPKVGVVEAALLLEAGWATEFDEIWVTHVPDDVAIERIMSRNGLSREDATARLRSQMTTERRLESAHVAINTNRAKEETEAIVREEWSKLTDRWKSK